jgi:hypothetical protein
MATPNVMNRAFKHYKDVDWTNEIDALIGTVPDLVVSERYAVAACPLNARRWTKKELAALGTMLDTELARQLGLSQSEVAAKRKELKIPPFRKAGPYDWKPKDLARRGKIPDDELALELGISFQYVAEKRLELGCSTGLVQLKRTQLNIPAITTSRLSDEPAK